MWVYFPESNYQTGDAPILRQENEIGLFIHSGIVSGLRRLFLFVAGAGGRSLLTKKSGAWIPFLPEAFCRGPAPFRSLFWVRETCRRLSWKAMWCPATAETAVGFRRKPMWAVVQKDPAQVSARKPVAAGAQTAWKNLPAGGTAFSPAIANLPLETAASLIKKKQPPD